MADHRQIKALREQAGYHRTRRANRRSSRPIPDGAYICEGVLQDRDQVDIFTAIEEAEQEEGS